MKRTLRFLARLYPPGWRKRYGPEFEALLEETTLKGGDAFDVFSGAMKMRITSWSLGKTLLVCSGAGVILAAASSLVVQNRYQSQSAINVRAEGKSAYESIQRLAGDLQRDLVTRESLASTIESKHLYTNQLAHIPLDEVIGDMRKNISLHTTTHASPANGDSVTFILQFNDSDSHVAEEVNSALVSRLLELSLQSAEQINSGPTFRVLDPPTVSPQSAWPRRARICTIGLMTGLLAGLILAMIVGARTSTTFRNA